MLLHFAWSIFKFCVKCCVCVCVCVYIHDLNERKFLLLRWYICILTFYANILAMKCKSILNICINDIEKLFVQNKKKIKQNTHILTRFAKAINHNVSKYFHAKHLSLLLLLLLYDTCKINGCQYCTACCLSISSLF